MKFSVTYPLISHPYAAELVTKDAMVRFACVAEAAGFDGIGFTDHPAPSQRWLEAGGHEHSTRSPRWRSAARSPIVWPYPRGLRPLQTEKPDLLVAKTVATIDALSGRSVHARRRHGISAP